MPQVDFTSSGICALRERLGLTITEFAVAVGASRRTVYRWERGLFQFQWQSHRQRIRDLTAELPSKPLMDYEHPEISDTSIQWACRRQGVPVLFLEDAVQDIRIELTKLAEVTKQIVRHKAIDAARRYGSRTRLGEERISTVTLTETHARRLQDNPLSHAEDPEAVFRLVKTITLLPERSRIILALVAVAGLKQRVIADFLRISESRVAHLLRRARLQYAEALVVLAS